LIVTDYLQKNDEFRQAAAENLHYLIRRRRGPVLLGFRGIVLKYRSLCNMQVGILVAGLMDGKLGTIVARAGHEVVFSYARSNEKLTRLVRDAQGNVGAGTPGEAAKEADAVRLAMHLVESTMCLNTRAICQPR
jgi:hypothetical protein